MCGRFAVTTDPALLAEQIDAINEVPATADPGPNYNVAPTDSIATVVSRHAEPGDDPTRRVRLMRWGLVPPWTKAGPDGTPVAGGPLLINARADKVTTSPAYRAAAEHKRCLVPMDGFYEWRVDPHEPGAKAGKTPFYLHGDGAMLFAAGLWSVWRPDRRFDPLLSVTIITTAAVGELARIHDRMPLLLPENRWDRWLDPDAPVDTALLADPPDVRGIALREVSTLVNSVRNNGPELVAAAEPQPGQAYLF
ncbi:SOS response-associated peptidase [[Mycobacterium] crassicus]|uniref:Abasic site processing protein n=1 Tax=[Mycobacterium] crassicus TaxID=2872309 RepID=A0ABU5XDF5_9MYCO|nr:SOS response-associated peptidase [Mycolicibacter sp. MYC098]MEB3020009.1 SOS response-associated peptidase [Mycolicibacter sp. MYC098]